MFNIYHVMDTVDEVLQQIKQIAFKYNVEKIVLFGSRARGDHSLVSDYDIAVFASDFTPMDKAAFWSEVDDIESLKKIDLLFVDETTSARIVENIMRDGVIIYE